MKILGYVLKGLSILLFVVLLINLGNTYEGIQEHLGDETSFLVGYIVGAILTYVGMIWAAISLYKYSKKLLLRSSSKSEITKIGDA